VLINNSEIKALSADIRKIIDGQAIDLRDNREGAWSLLRNDIHTLASLKNEQVDALQRDRDTMKDNLTDISHQLKTPLTSMLIMADLLETAPPDKQAEFLANIKTSLTRMEWLVSALLKMAQLDAGAITFAREDVSAEALAEQALEPLKILLELKNQSVESACATDLSCDRRWTAEALTNIVKNASEYSPLGGVITLESGINPICSWISVSDSGAGIAGADIARLFRRFAGARSEKGQGVGLPLALAIMRGQNGDIEVDGGGGGKGATFTLKFYK
jgi:signal transduction histidine kinase